MEMSIILSFRNEETIIPELIEVLHKAIRPLEIEYELVFINDMSTDKSLEILKGYLKTDKTVRVLDMSRNFGNQQCILAGIKHSSGSCILIMDADLQDPPEVIPEMYSEFKKGFEVVHTKRLSRAGENPIKMWITSAAYWILSRTTKIIPEDAGNFKLFSRRVANEILNLNEKTIFLRGMIPWVGFSNTYVYYHRLPRFRGETKIPLLGGTPARDFFNALISFSNAPITIIFRTGLVTVFMAFVLIVAAVFMSISQGEINKVLAISALIFLFSGVQLLSTGMVGLYVIATFDAARKRPDFIISEKLGY